MNFVVLSAHDITSQCSVFVYNTSVMKDVVTVLHDFIKVTVDGTDGWMEG